MNDDFGIATGDTILLTVGRRLKRLLKPQDTLARLGSDQFGLILLSQTDVDGVAQFAEELRDAIKAPITFANREIVLTGAIGLTGWADASSSKEALKEAELAMYQAKRSGGDAIEPFRPSYRATGNGRLQVEADLRRAFERNELSLAFQPIVKLDGEAIAGFEALLRWEHPRRGAISPSEFVPIAESIGLIVKLGQFALEEAVKRIGDWQRLTGDTSLFISVNISSRQLIRQDLIADVKAVLDRYRIAPECLKLELTESMVMDNPERSGQLLTRLRELGVGLALDDFGTGYSSLAYLMGFPFDTLKIDQSFLRNNHPASAADHPALHRDHGARSRPESGCRRRRKRRGRHPAAATGLRIRPELPLLAPTNQRRGAQAAAGTTGTGAPRQLIRARRVRRVQPAATSGVTGLTCQERRFDAEKLQGAAVFLVPAARRRRSPDRPCRSTSHWRQSRSPAGRRPSRNSRAP